MKKVLITGGTGNLGKQVVDFLSPYKEFEISILSSRSNAHSSDNVKIFKGDLANNIGLAKATEKAEIIIHCASDPTNFNKVDIEGTENLLNSLDKKIRNFIYISIVGVDKSNYPYYKISGREYDCRHWHSIYHIKGDTVSQFYFSYASTIYRERSK